MFQRTWDAQSAAKKKSVLLLGPRQTGKSTLLHQAFPGAIFIDLLNSKTFRQLAAAPELLADIARGAGKTPIVIDEVQKLPALIDEVQRLLFENPARHFILTGSSARKLRKQGVNLLGGRMSRQLLCPLSFCEVASVRPAPAALKALIAWGGLPSVLQSDEPAAELEDYVGLYLKEEIQAEANVRAIAPFTRFLEIAALSVGQQILYSNVANDCQVPATTVRDYFQLLEDTLVGHLLPPLFTAKRKAHASSKFYFFDVGVANTLRGVAGLSRGHEGYGTSFEHHIFCELKAWQAYRQPRAKLFYWRSLSNFEVDFVVQLPGECTIAIEAKATSRVSQKHTRGLRALAQEFPTLTKAVVCEEGVARTTEDGVDIVPVAQLEPWLDGAAACGRP